VVSGGEKAGRGVIFYVAGPNLGCLFRREVPFGADLFIRGRFGSPGVETGGALRKPHLYSGPPSSRSLRAQVLAPKSGLHSSALYKSFQL